MQQHKETLNRTIGLWGLSANIINSVIGAGIFVIPAIVAASLGSASIFAYLFCGALIVLVMLCFAEVGSKITHPGGAYAYIEQTFGKIFDAEILLKILRERKMQETKPSDMLTEDPIVLNQLMNSLQYFNGALNLGEAVSVKRHKTAQDLILLIQKTYNLN